ncbi:putative salicylate carboxymethyltransferase [Helianthus annuus]|nr:putative salicylate carboxymethyltransferase [Helianthus annuus]
MYVLHMNVGEGETSYAKNSLIQKKIIYVGSSMMEAAIFNILLEVKPKSMGVADLGCSSGPNALTAISRIIHMVDAASQKMGLPVPEIRVSLNDLPGNDFNGVFKSLPELYNNLKDDYGIEDCYVWGVPGSFYGRLFPGHSLHFVHSSSSLHWLSQVYIFKLIDKHIYNLRHQWVVLQIYYKTILVITVIPLSSWSNFIIIIQVFCYILLEPLSQKIVK